MKLGAIIDRTAVSLRDIAVLALAFMMLITCADIALRWTINKPIFGAFELVELSQLFVVFLALPKVFAGGNHIKVNIIDNLIGPRFMRVLVVVGAICSLAFILLIGANMLSPAYDAYRFGDRTMDLYLLRIWFWLPVFVGIAASAIVCVFIVVQDMRALKD